MKARRTLVLATASLGGPGDFVDLNADGDNDELTMTGSVSALFQSGADGPLTYSLSTDTSGLRRRV